MKMFENIKNGNNKRYLGDILLYTFIILFALGACTYDTLEFEPVTTPDTVSFLNDINLPVFQVSCATPGCHNEGGIPPDLSENNAYISLTFFGYVDTANAEQSILYQIISGSESMAKYATDQDRALILKWIEQGAKNN